MDAELSKPFNLCFRILKCLGLWQDGSQTWTYFFFGLFLNFLVFQLFIISEIFYIANVQNLKELVDAMPHLIVYISLEARAINFVFKVKEMVLAVEKIEEILNSIKDIKNARRIFVQKRANVGHKIIKIYWTFAIAASSFELLAGIFSHDISQNVWFPFNTKTSEIGFWLATVYLVISLIAASTFAPALDILPIININFSVGLIEELCDRLREVKTNEDLIKCIKIHIKIKEFVHDMHNKFASVILIDGILSSTVLCVCAFSLSTVSL